MTLLDLDKHAADGVGGGGWTCQVEQGHYGHRARKATWLYAYSVDLPTLAWGPSRAIVKLDEGFHTAAERAAARARGVSRPELMGRRERLATPTAFRDLLLAIARSAQEAHG